MYIPCLFLSTLINYLLFLITPLMNDFYERIKAGLRNELRFKAARGGRELKPKVNF